LGTVEFLYLDQESVLAADVLDMRRAINVVGKAQAQFARGEVREPQKIVLRNADTVESEKHGRFNGLAASIGGLVRSAIGLKWIASFPANRQLGRPRASALIILNCPQTGVPLAVMEGGLISAMRTGAMTALGARYLAPRQTRKIGIVGAGLQSRTQILGLCTEFPNLEEIVLFGRQISSAEAVAEDCRRRWSAPIRTTRTILQCKKIVAHDWETVKQRGIMTPAIMRQQGLLRDEDVQANLGELILGTKTGRESKERIHYCHMGMGLADVALAWAVYETARERNLGMTLPLWNEPLWV